MLPAYIPNTSHALQPSEWQALQQGSCNPHPAGHCGRTSSQQASTAPDPTQAMHSTHTTKSKHAQAFTVSSLHYDRAIGRRLMWCFMV